MIVIADTSPLNYLIRIGHIDVLPKVYDRIVIPPSVQAELNHPQAPEMVSQWIAQPAAWLENTNPSTESGPRAPRSPIGAR
jgi:predicted nucleic acid-binding protein